ncbi:RPAP1-like protein [Phialemonium atrogriseum]|uniref:RPAP1-like protein n=1 Tax=Phialemonium atrogriseum TaxID=1093897 RepID=A0AAJ0BZC3_9PEZI|nr:RPAP1-like protein [Phialemonium atrogriseum]KAK1767303.1 RPAP1-like protein [Phialemonium atrogriseum]
MDPTQLVLDVKEKAVDNVKPPTFPAPSSGTTGFPAHKKRARVSAFKQQRQQKQSTAEATPTYSSHDRQPLGSSSSAAPSEENARPTDQSQSGLAAEDKRRIDRENQTRLETMSQAEIEEAQKELLKELDPSILQMLLKRANISEPRDSSPFDNPRAPNTPQPPTVTVEDTSAAKQARLDNTENGQIPSIESQKIEAPGKLTKKVTFDEDAAPPAPPGDLFPLSTQPSQAANKPADVPSARTTHFPSAPPVPDLNPSDPDFLANLHSKFFPNLPADPSKLAWMAPIPTTDSPADRDSPYHPSQSSLPVSALRFDFRGSLLPPRLSRSIPASMGLHHHGEAPEAAGYTVPELARLARSAVPAQRCVAFQTLGRILFRLGDGEWGAGEGGRVGDEDDLAFAIWRLFRQGRVLETLEEAAAVEEGAGHRGARVYAIEALWLFEKGGWKEKWRGL